THIFQRGFAACAAGLTEPEPSRRTGRSTDVARAQAIEGAEDGVVADDVLGDGVAERAVAFDAEDLPDNLLPFCFTRALLCWRGGGCRFGGLGGFGGLFGRDGLVCHLRD